MKRRINMITLTPKNRLEIYKLARARMRHEPQRYPYICLTIAEIVEQGYMPVNRMGFTSRHVYDYFYEMLEVFPHTKRFWKKKYHHWKDLPWYKDNYWGHIRRIWKLNKMIRIVERKVKRQEYAAKKSRGAT